MINVSKIMVVSAPTIFSCYFNKKIVEQHNMYTKLLLPILQNTIIHIIYYKNSYPDIDDIYSM